MASRIRRHGKLSREARAKINQELAYFEGDAKEAYLREVKPALFQTVPIEMPEETGVPSPGPAEVVGKPDEAARKAALRQWADPAWSDPLSPIQEPGSYDHEIYDPDVLARKAAERKFDEYDRKEYGAHGVIYKRSGSGRVYANDIAAKDYKELTERYGLKVSTDPDRVVLPPGTYAFESVYESKLLKKVMEENKLPPEAIHRVAAQLEAEIESGAYQSIAGTARFSHEPLPAPARMRTASPVSKPVAPPPRRRFGSLRRAYFKLRLVFGLAGRGLDRAGANPTIGPGGGAARPVPALQESASPNLTFPRGTDVTNRSTFPTPAPQEGSVSPTRQPAGTSAVPEPIAAETTGRIPAGEAPPGEVVGNYRLLGEARLQGNTFERRILGITRITPPTGERFEPLFKSFIQEAKAHGAAELRVTIEAIGNPKVYRNVGEMKGWVESLGGKINYPDGRTVEIIIPVSTR